MPPRSRLAIACIAACTAATGVYALLRLGQWLLVPETNPALVIYSDHAAYFWRAWTAAYFGVAVGFSASLRAERIARLLPASVTLATAILILQSLLLP